MRTPRAPRYPYRYNEPWPHERRGEFGPLMQDSISGYWFPEVYATEGPFGVVDGRNGATLDLDVELHEATDLVVYDYPPGT